MDIGARRVAIASDTAHWEFDTGKKNTQRGAELDLLYQECVRVFEVTRATEVFVETPMVGRGGARVAIQLSQTQAVVLLAAEHVGAFAYEVAVGTWKKAVVGKGNAKKHEVAEFARETWKELEAESQDVIDARCIQEYGARVMERAEEMA